MKLSEANKIMKGELIGQDAHFFGASTDTRKLTPGQLFFAWKGDNFDAHDFLESAEAKGAIAAVVERYIPSAEINQIVVRDSLKALGDLAKGWRQQWKGRCIALTGSNGKTTLKEMIYAIISQESRALATEGNYNNHVGCPLTLLHLTSQHQYAVIEMGANHPHELDYLTSIVRPDIAIINNAGACHLEGFGDLQGVAKAKAEIFNGLAADGIGIINREDQFCDFWIECLAGKRHLTFGLSDQADIYASNIHGQTFTLNYQQEKIEITLQLVGQHNILNAVASAAACIAIGMTLASIKKGLEDIIAVEGRFQRILLSEKVTLINDAYNANPNSLKAAIDSIVNANRWLVLGDMRELGVTEKEIHRDCGQYAKDKGFSKLFGLGVLAKEAVHSFGEGGASFSEHEALLKELQKMIDEYDDSEPLIILVKGSNSMNMQYFIKELTQKKS